MADKETKDTGKSLEELQADRPSAAENVAASAETLEQERLARLKPADIGAASSAKGNMDASGAIMEPSVKSAVDVDHPAVDNNPRANTTEAQNRIDFNDPTQTDREAVEERLANQG